MSVADIGGRRVSLLRVALRQRRGQEPDKELDEKAQLDPRGHRVLVVVVLVPHGLRFTARAYRNQGCSPQIWGGELRTPVA